MRERPAVRFGLALTMALWPVAALAHQAGGEAIGFLGGLKHPISGLDHVLAMVAVGLWGAQLGAPAIWLLPVTFPMVMAFGGMLALLGVPLPGGEIGIAVSAIALGLAVMAEARPPLPAAAVLVGFFAIFHGHAHGTELPPGANGLLYSVGFVIATGGLHATGIAVGLVHRWRAGAIALRAAGAVVAGAGVVFFAFIGFDAVSTAAQETKNPKRDMPIGILGSLVVCTVLYVLFSYVLSGIATVDDFRTAGREASVAFAITKYMTGFEWLSKLVTIAILAGFSSVILVMLLGQSRVFYSMSHDGLVPKVFSEVHPRYRTPYKSNMLFFVFTSLFAAFLPEDIVGEMTSIGTLFAFILVCIGVWIMRKRRPDIPRGFTVPALPLVAILGIIVCGSMIYGLGWTNWLRLAVWLVIGLVFYFSYSKQHSRLESVNHAVVR